MGRLVLSFHRELFHSIALYRGRGGNGPILSLVANAANGTSEPRVPDVALNPKDRDLCEADIAIY